jgi:hypothetical protein
MQKFDLNKNTLFLNVNTIKDRKKILLRFIKPHLKLGKSLIFLFPSFWQAFLFYKELKKQYPNIIKLLPICPKSFSILNFTDYYTFLKAISSYNLPINNFSFLIFDLDLFVQDKNFFLYKIFFQQHKSYCATLCSLFNQIHFNNFLLFEQTIPLKSKFKPVISFIPSTKLKIPKQSLFICLERSFLYESCNNLF